MLAHDVCPVGAKRFGAGCFFLCINMCVDMDFGQGLQWHNMIDGPEMAMAQYD